MRCAFRRLRLRASWSARNLAMRRFIRLANGVSKKAENLAFAVALHLMYYKFVRIHHTLRITPAMEAGISDRVWGISEIVALCPR